MLSYIPTMEASALEHPHCTLTGKTRCLWIPERNGVMLGERKGEELFLGYQRLLDFGHCSD